MIKIRPEMPLRFVCQGRVLYGILHGVEHPSDTGLLVVVGGPQYRIGSHRQFVLLGRDLARRGTPVMRFDYRGMGDSEGELGAPEPCEYIDNDIRCAIDTFIEQVPGLRRVVLWGICDGASAICLYASKDHRVAGLVLLNPWVGSEHTFARMYLKFYYLRYALGATFWQRMLRGQVAIVPALVSFLRTVHKAFVRSPNRAQAEVAEAGDDRHTLERRMLSSLTNFSGPVLVILSGNDPVARQFTAAVDASADWRQTLHRPSITHRQIPDADHTFSTRTWSDQVMMWTSEWVHCAAGPTSASSRAPSVSRK